MRFSFAALTALVTVSAISSQDEHVAEFKVYRPAEIKWSIGLKVLPPGAEVAVLEGDPSKQGPFVIRLKLPDGYRVPPHTHPKTERITVLSGTFNIGMGDKFAERSLARRLLVTRAERRFAPAVKAPGDGLRSKKMGREPRELWQKMAAFVMFSRAGSGTTTYANGRITDGAEVAPWQPACVFPLSISRDGASGRRSSCQVVSASGARFCSIAPIGDATVTHA
jgi:hypothetical protein